MKIIEISTHWNHLPISYDICCSNMIFVDQCASLIYVDHSEYKLSIIVLQKIID